jgi:hypothetical protein
LADFSSEGSTKINIACLQAYPNRQRRAMKARITIEYELAGPEGLTRAKLRDREEEAWMTGAIAIPDLTAAVVKFELLDGQ